MIVCTLHRHQHESLPCPYFEAHNYTPRERMDVLSLDNRKNYFNVERGTFDDEASLKRTAFQRRTFICQGCPTRGYMWHRDGDDAPQLHDYHVHVRCGVCHDVKAGHPAELEEAGWHFKRETLRQIVGRCPKHVATLMQDARR